MSESRFALEVARRNARLRAWRAYGLPVEGAWAQAPSGYQLQLACGRCLASAQALISSLLLSTADLSTFTRALPEYERHTLRRLEGKGCAELAPLRGGDPAAVREIWALELLSL